MADSDRVFAVASEKNLVDLIERARKRLVVIGPAVTDAVATAIAARLDDGLPGVTVIVDADPEVYRLGYGTETGLDLLRAASARNLLDLRVQAGIRIGVVISDDITMVFSPVPLLIEAGSKSVEKPNAIVLSGGAVDRLAEAAGAALTETAEHQEIGTTALTPEAVLAVKADLKVNPPQPFDVARALRVFSSKLQYVEFSAENYRFSSHQVGLPSALLDIVDEELKDQITSRVRLPAATLGKFEIAAELESGDTKTTEVDEKWISRERRRIEDKYTYPLARYGRVIFSSDRVSFDNSVERFKRNLGKYCTAVSDGFDKIKTDFGNTIVNEYLPKWLARPPADFDRYGLEPNEENLKKELHDVVDIALRSLIAFEAPQVRLTYKNIAPESVLNPDFIEPLKRAMRKRRVPNAVIEKLFASGDAAPAKDSFRS